MSSIFHCEQRLADLLEEQKNLAHLQPHDLLLSPGAAIDRLRRVMDTQAELLTHLVHVLKQVEEERHGRENRDG